MTEIDPKDFGALEADVKTLTTEVRMLRQEMAQVNAMINQGKGGIYIMVLAAGAIGSSVTLFMKKLFG